MASVNMNSVVEIGFEMTNERVRKRIILSRRDYPAAWFSSNIPSPSRKRSSPKILLGQSVQTEAGQ